MAMGGGGGRGEVTSEINVTPMADVMLVLLIIFMVAAPLKPSRFLANVPSQPDRNARVDPNPKTLVVTIKSDRTLMLNRTGDMGSIYDTVCFKSACTTTPIVMICAIDLICRTAFGSKRPSSSKPRARSRTLM